jgi:lysozyme
MALLDSVIDVSDAQNKIDWHKVAAAGIKVAMIKATEGATFTADTWRTNRDGAKNAGIAVIPYHFLTIADAKAQADHFSSVAGLAKGMPYALDWEGVGTASPDQVDLIGHTLVELTGRTPLGYWGIPGSTPTKFKGGPAIPPSDFMETWERWVPRFRVGEIPDFSPMPSQFTTPFGPPHKPSVPGNFLFWQYTHAGTIDGISVNTDRSVGSFPDAAAMVAWVATGTVPVA